MVNKRTRIIKFRYKKILYFFQREKIEKGFSRPPTLDAQHLWQRGYALYYNREFEKAFQCFNDITRNYPKSPYAPEAYYQAGLSQLRQKNFDEAVAWFKKGWALFKGNRWGDKSQYKIAQIHDFLGDKEKARKALEAIINGSPTGEVTDEAALKLLEMNFASKRFRDAEAMGQFIVSHFPRRETASRALFTLASGYFDRGGFKKAADFMQKLEKQRMEPALRHEFLFWKGELLESQGNLADAAEAYRTIRRDNLRSYYALRAGDALEKLRPRIYGKDYGETWGKGLSAYEAGNYRQAMFELEKLFAEFPGGDKNAEAGLMLADCFSKVPLYTEVHFLREAGPDDLLPRESRKGRQEDVHSLKGVALARIHCYGEAAQELSAAIRRSDANLNQLYTLALYHERAGEPNKSLRIAEELGERIPSDYPTELLPIEILGLLYPTHYSDLVFNESRAADIDPALVFSVIREESRFSAAAKSEAGAFGLMQFIPETARRIAASLEMNDFAIENLYDPALNIRMGARYLRELIDKFEGSYPEAVAAYNAGEENTVRWEATRTGSNTESFIRRIDFEETKSYVKKIMASYAMYRRVLAVGAFEMGERAGKTESDTDD